MAEQKSPPLIFQHSSFAIVRSPELTEEIAEQIDKQITLFGGEVIYDEYPEHKLDLSLVTHIISTTNDFPDYHDAVEQFKHVVKPEYIGECVATSRLTHPRRFSPDPNLIMSDVVAMCVGLPQGDKDAIIGGILAMGGNYSPKLTSQVTHIVALAADSDLQEQIDDHDLDTVQILPHWFDQCLRLGKKISDTPYLLPGADLTLRPGEVPVSAKHNKHIQDALSSTPTELDLPEDASRRELKVFKYKKVLLDDDLDLSPSLRNILTNIIQSNHGMVVTKVSTADIVICKYREGQNYVTATLKKADVGSLSWLYFLIVHDVWTSPFKRLLHYPLPQNPLPGFENFRISVSNYGGEARTYLENLIAATGAERTKNFKPDNTHLITAHTKSQKVDAAQEWGKLVVNHLWVEESFAKWEMQPVTKSRYLIFPDKTHLGEVVGQTEVDRAVIMAKFIPQNGDSPAKQPGSVASSSSIAVASASAVLDNAKSAKTNAKVKQGSKSATELVTPSATRVAKLGKENVTPGTGSSRKSKMVAAAKLHDMADDIILYQKESKRAGGVMYGGRRAGDQDRIEVNRKRSAEPDGIEVPRSTSKRQRTSSVTVRMRLLVSGHKSWTNKARKEDEDIKKLREMGIDVVTEADQATHVAVPQIVRTPKFLTAIAYAPIVLSDEFIDACLEEGEYQDPKGFVLADKKYEQENDYSLAKVLKSAKSNGGKLFQGMKFYCAEKVTPDFKILEAVTKANGGTLTIYRGRHLAPERADGDDHRAFLFADDTPEGKRLWPKFQTTITANEMEPHLLLVEWLVSSAFRQELLPLDKYRF